MTELTERLSIFIVLIKISLSDDDKRSQASRVNEFNM